MSLLGVQNACRSMNGDGCVVGVGTRGALIARMGTGYIFADRAWNDGFWFFFISCSPSFIILRRF